MSERIIVRVPSEVREIAPGYLDNRRHDVPAMKDALARKDFELIAKLCHKTKGTAAGYGFAELGLLAKALETAAHDRDLATSETIFATLSHYLTRVEIAPESAPEK